MKFSIIQPILLSVMFILSSFGIYGQKLHIVPNHGAEQTYDLKNIRKITFSDGNFIVNDFEETNHAFEIPSVRKMFFSDITTGIENLSAQEAQIHVFPNPATDILYVKNLPETVQIAYLFNINGVLLLKKPVSATDNSIDVNHLNKGMYLLRVNNYTAKFGKL